MTTLIKATDRASLSERVRPLGPPRGACSGEPEALDEVLALRGELDQLRQALHASHEEIQQLKGDVSKAFADGEAQGRRRGMAESDERRSAYLIRLERGVDKALAQFAVDLKALEALSLQLARESLSKVLDNAADYDQLMAAAIRRQLAMLESANVVRILVSLEDFGDETELEALRSKIDRRDLDLGISPDLGAGECHVQLKLGGLEIGVGQQWSRLSEALQAQARAEAVI